MRSDTLVTGIVPGGSKNQSLVQKDDDLFYAHMYINYNIHAHMYISQPERP